VGLRVVATRPWHEADPWRLEELRGELVARYPTLGAVIEGDRVVIRGTFPVVAEREVLDRYEIEVHLGRDDPHAWPDVREIGGRIPRVADRHVFPRSGNACLCLPEDRAAAWPPGSSILDFLAGPLRNYLLAQTSFEREGTWPFGERAHDADGVLEFYAEQLGSEDLRQGRRLLLLLTREEIKGHWPCPCGSGEPMRRCHLETVRDVRRRVSVTRAKTSLKFVEDLEQARAAGKTPT
jgi:hypothetical protein